MRSQRLGSWVWPACVLWLLLADVAQSRSVEVAPEPLSVVELLARIAAEADPEASPFLNDRRAQSLEQDFRAEADMSRKLGLGFLLGKEWLLAGQTEAAVGILSEMQELLQQPGAVVDPELFRELTEQLVVAYLRLGEQDNCVAEHSAKACLFPLAPEARHQRQRGSRNAERMLSWLLRQRHDLRYRWLLNLASMTLGEYPDEVPGAWLIPPETFRSEDDFPRFDNLAPSLDIGGLGLSGGSIMEDFDRDGFLDLMASSWGLSDQLRYWRNKGDGTFREMAEEAGLKGQLGGLNLSHGDYDNDGYADVLVLRGAWLGTAGRHPSSLLRNNGDGTFEDVTIAAGLLSLHPTQTGAWADFDRDGWLDLFIGTESTRQEESPCKLYRNLGDGTFLDVAPQVGLDVVGFVKGATWGDYDNDGWPDLYLSRFGQSNLLFRNQGPRGRSAGSFAWGFEEVSGQAGVVDPPLSFATWFWDMDNDGHEDLMVAPFSGPTGNSLEEVVRDYLGLASTGARPRLYKNQGNGTFRDVTRGYRFDRVLLAMGANFGDVDNDGFLDAYFGTGEPSLMTLVPNRMFRNDEGRRFQEITSAGGFGHLQKGHGISFGDLDNDGDQDIYAVMGGAFSGDIYPNALFVNPGNRNHWLTLRFAGTSSNRLAIGARVRLVVATPNGELSIYRTVGSGGSFGSSSLQLEVGLGKAQAIDRVEVRWPDLGAGKQIFRGLELDRTYLLRQGASVAEEVSARRLDLASRGGVPGAHEKTSGGHLSGPNRPALPSF